MTGPENREKLPKVNKKPTAAILIAAVFAVLVLILRSSWGAELLSKLSNGGGWLFPLIGAAAVIDSVNVCAFSVLILTVAFLFGAGRLKSSILKIGGAYIFGIFLAYLLIGLGIMHALYLFNTPHFAAKVGAAILIALGAINIINDFFPAFPIKLKIPESGHRKIAKLIEKASMPAAFLLGGFVGLSELPCTAGPYLVALGLLHDHAAYWKGFGYLVLYNLIFVLPLIIILLVAANESLLRKIEIWKKERTGEMRFWVGLAMVALGIIIFLI